MREALARALNAKLDHPAIRLPGLWLARLAEYVARDRGLLYCTLHITYIHPGSTLSPLTVRPPRHSRPRLPFTLPHHHPGPQSLRDRHLPVPSATATRA